MHYFIEAITTKYFDFKSRARRSEFWSVCLFSFLISLVFIFLILLSFRFDWAFLGGVLIGLYIIWYFFMIIPSLAVAFRRLHDAGFSGWWFLLGLIPFFGSVTLLVFYFLNSQKGINKWGINPKGL